MIVHRIFHSGLARMLDNSKPLHEEELANIVKEFESAIAPYDAMLDMPRDFGLLKEPLLSLLGTPEPELAELTEPLVQRLDVDQKAQLLEWASGTLSYYVADILGGQGSWKFAGSGYFNSLSVVKSMPLQMGLWAVKWVLRISLPFLSHFYDSHNAGHLQNRARSSANFLHEGVVRRAGKGKPSQMSYNKCRELAIREEEALGQLQLRLESVSPQLGLNDPYEHLLGFFHAIECPTARDLEPQDRSLIDGLVRDLLQSVLHAGRGEEIKEREPCRHDIIPYPNLKFLADPPRFPDWTEIERLLAVDELDFCNAQQLEDLLATIRWMIARFTFAHEVAPKLEEIFYIRRIIVPDNECIRIPHMLVSMAEKYLKQCLSKELPYDSTFYKWLSLELFEGRIAVKVSEMLQMGTLSCDKLPERFAK